MRIAEIYKSKQGEGFLTGTESVFVRTSGCNLRCWFCDTPYTSWSPEGEDLPVEEILRQVRALECSHVVITGGEPMLFAELLPLCTGLRGLDRNADTLVGETNEFPLNPELTADQSVRPATHITIETAGTLYLPVQCDLMSISPKLSNSTPSLEQAPQWHGRHERTRQAPDVIQRLTGEYAYQLKFVVETPEDCREVHHYLAEFPSVDRSRVLLMPQGTESSALARVAEWLEPYCREHRFHFCPRKHIEWYGFQRGT